MQHTTCQITRDLHIPHASRRRYNPRRHKQRFQRRAAAYRPELYPLRWPPCRRRYPASGQQQIDADPEIVNLICSTAKQLQAPRQRQLAVPGQAQDRIRQGVTVYQGRACLPGDEGAFQSSKGSLRRLDWTGLEKNTPKLCSLFGLANLMLAKRYLQRTAG